MFNLVETKVKMKTLHLVVDRHHFMRIVSEKRVDWRKVKPYYAQRLEDKQYDRVCFRNGYHKDAPRATYEYKGYKQHKELYMIFVSQCINLNAAAEHLIDKAVSDMFANAVNDMA